MTATKQAVNAKPFASLRKDSFLDHQPTSLGHSKCRRTKNGSLTHFALGVFTQARALLGCSSKKEKKADTDEVKSSIYAYANKGRRVKLDANRRRPDASPLLWHRWVVPISHDLPSSPKQQINHHRVDRNSKPELNRVRCVETLKTTVHQTVENV